MVIDIILLSVYALMGIVFASLLGVAVKRRSSVPLMHNLAWILFFLVLWCANNVLFILSQTENQALVLRSLAYPIRSFTILFLLFYLFRFHNYTNLDKPIIKIVLMIIPACSVVWALLASHISFLLDEPQIQLKPYHLVTAGLTPQSRLILFYCCFVFVISAIIIISKHLRIPQIYRAPSIQLVYGLIWLTIGVGAYFVHIEFFPIDLLLISTTFTMRYIYRSTESTQGLEFLTRARNEVFNHLAETILVLDEDSNIISTNKKADEWIAALGVRREGLTYHAVIDALQQKATQSQPVDEDEGGVDYYFDTNGETSAFNLREKVIRDNRKRPIGTFVIYSDVTENRALLQRLEVSAGRDALTGLNNRNMMNNYKVELVRPENLPAAVILCDLNNLKKVNDGDGHQQGDLMLRIAGDALLNSCPPKSMAGRIGGDEFLVLLPNSDMAQAEELMTLIDETLKISSQTSPFEVTMAMGAAILDSADRSIEEIIEIADQVMYENKRKMKAAQAAAAAAAAAG